MSIEHKRKYDVSIDIAIEKQMKWISSLINTTIKQVEGYKLVELIHEEKLVGLIESANLVDFIQMDKLDEHLQTKILVEPFEQKKLGELIHKETIEKFIKDQNRNKPLNANVIMAFLKKGLINGLKKEGLKKIEPSIKAEKDKLSAHVYEQVGYFLSDLSGYRYHESKEKHQLVQGPARIFETKQITYRFSRLLGLVVLTDDNIEASIEKLINNYQLMRSSTDLNICLMKIGENINSRYHLDQSSDEWNIQVGLIACFKLWLCSVLENGSVYSDAEKIFSKLCRLYFDNVLQKPPGGRLSSHNKKLTALLSAMKSTRFNNDFSVTAPSIKDNKSKKQITVVTPPIYRASIYIFISKPSVYLTNRYKLILLNRWIEIFFPKLATNQRSTESLNKDYFLWIARIFYIDITNKILDLKFNDMVSSYQNDECLNEGISYFGLQFSELLISELNAAKVTIKDDDDILLFSPLNESLNEINLGKEHLKYDQFTSNFFSLIDFLYTSSADLAIPKTVRHFIELKVGELESISLLTDAIMSWEGTGIYKWIQCHKADLISSLIKEHPNYGLRFHEWFINVDKDQIRRKIREVLAEQMLINNVKPKDALNELLKTNFLGDKK